MSGIWDGVPDETLVVGGGPVIFEVSSLVVCLKGLHIRVWIDRIQEMV